MYVLDEPSIGLHQRDNERLLGTLTRLRDLGNTVIVVEHDEDAIRLADHIVDIGPGGRAWRRSRGAGHAQADITRKRRARSPVSTCPASVAPSKVPTEAPPRRIRPACCACGRVRQQPAERRPGDSGRAVRGGHRRVGFRQVHPDQRHPVPHHRDRDERRVGQASPYREITGPGPVRQGRRHRPVADRSHAAFQPATYTGLFTPLRELFAQVPEARARGYNAGRFSFNVRGGRCEACQGDGLIKVEMHFLPDVYVPCDVCHGKRYNRETLEILYKGHTIHDVLEMTVEDALKLFEPVPVLARKLETLMDVGLSYIKLGQSATTLSGGEAQRVKLSKELSRRDTGRTLYILDEPTTGLHFHDIEQLLGGAAHAARRRQHRGRDRTQPGRDQDRGLGRRPRPGGRPSWRPDRGPPRIAHRHLAGEPSHAARARPRHHRGASDLTSKSTRWREPSFSTNST
jgi:excinuclease ABC subunit A